MVVEADLQPVVEADLQPERPAGISSVMFAFQILSIFTERIVIEVVAGIATMAYEYTT